MNLAQSLSNPSLVPRRRWRIVFLLSFGVLVNFFDRVNLSVSQDALHTSFGLSMIAFGFLSSAYSWTYAAMQIPAGILLDRWGVRRVGCGSTLLWSVASFGAAISSGIAGFFGARFLLGVGESPTFPANAKAIGYWFPENERSLATAITDAAAKFSTAIGVPFLGLVLLRFGWRWSFAATGLISFFYFLLFYWIYYNPSTDKALSKEERQFMMQGHVQPEGAVNATRGASLGYLLRQPKVYGLGLGWGAYNYCFYLLLTWLPSYLSISLHVDLLHSVLYTSAPWLFATLTDLVVGGWLVDALIRRGCDASRVRQTVLVVGTGFGLGILGAAHAALCGHGPDLDQYFPGRSCSCSTGRVDSAISDRAARKCRQTGRNRQLLRPASSDFSADRHGLCGVNHSRVYISICRRHGDLAAGHCGIYFLAEPYRTNPGTLSQ